MKLKGGGGWWWGYVNRSVRFTSVVAVCLSVREVSRLPKRRGSTTRDRNLYANIKTAMMLFVVTLVFIVAFAPAWLMAHQLAPMQVRN